MCPESARDGIAAWMRRIALLHSFIHHSIERRGRREEGGRGRGRKDTLTYFRSHITVICNVTNSSRISTLRLRAPESTRDGIAAQMCIVALLSPLLTSSHFWHSIERRRRGWEKGYPCTFRISHHSNLLHLKLPLNLYTN